MNTRYRYIRGGIKILRAHHLLVFVLIFLLLGFFLRTFGLNSSSFWLDEVHSYERASQGSWVELHSRLRDRNHAPLYSAVLLRIWMKFGDGEFFLRFLTAAIGVLNISVVSLLGKDLFDAEVGLLSAFLLATSPMHIYYSKVARMYVPTALFISFAIYFLSRGVRHGRWWNWGGYVLGAILSLYTHYYSALTLISVSCIILAEACIKKDWRLAQSLILSSVTIGLLFTPWLPTFWVQLRGNPVSWISPITWQSFHTTFTRFFVQNLVLGPAYPILACMLALALVAGSVAMFRSRENDPGAWWAYLLVASGFLGPIIIALAISLLKPLIVGRYFVTTIVPASVVLSQGIAELCRHRWGRPINVVLIAGILVSAYGAGTTHWLEDWRRAADYVIEHARPGDVLVFGSHLHKSPFNYYYHGTVPQYSLPTDPTCRDEPACRTKVSQDIGSLHPKRLWMVQTERFHGDTSIKGYVADLEVSREIPCQDFGGFWDAKICLFTVQDCE